MPYFTESCNCLLAYEYVVAAGMRGTSQQSIIKPGSNQSVNRSLLLGGRKDGNICVLNWENGEVEFEIEVTLLVCYHLSGSIVFHSFEAEIANEISSFK